MKVKNCECCYMPMAKDVKESRSDQYCSLFLDIMINL